MTPELQPVVPFPLCIHLLTDGGPRSPPKPRQAPIETPATSLQDPYHPHPSQQQDSPGRDVLAPNVSINLCVIGPPVGRPHGPVTVSSRRPLRVDLAAGSKPRGLQGGKVPGSGLRGHWQRTTAAGCWSPGVKCPLSGEAEIAAAWGGWAIPRDSREEQSRCLSSQPPCQGQARDSRVFTRPPKDALAGVCRVFLKIWPPLTTAVTARPKTLCKA